VQQALHRDAPAAEHVVRGENAASVQLDGREGVQPLEDKVDVLVRQRRIVRVQRGLVLPVAEPDPLQLALVGAGKRVDDHAVAQQVGLDRGGNSGGVPLLRVGMGVGAGRACRQAESPSLHREAGGAAGGAGQQGAGEQNGERYQAMTHGSCLPPLPAH
jgi:hypothetical protein